MVFRDDECRIRRDNAPDNFATSKHVASNLIRAKGDKNSKSRQSKAAISAPRAPGRWTSL
jgi:hypothetical protein